MRCLLGFFLPQNPAAGHAQPSAVINVLFYLLRSGCRSPVELSLPTSRIGVPLRVHWVAWARCFPKIRTVMADAGHESRKMANQLLSDNGWELQITKRGQRASRSPA